LELRSWGRVVGVRVKMDRRGMLDTWKSGGIYYPGAEEMLQHNTESHTKSYKKSYPLIWCAEKEEFFYIDDKLAIVSFASKNVYFLLIHKNYEKKLKSQQARRYITDQRHAI
jgi:hypothetical protein